MRNETSNLLAALHDLDGDMVELMLGLLTDELSADEQRRFGKLCRVHHGGDVRGRALPDGGMEIDVTLPAALGGSL